MTTLLDYIDGIATNMNAILNATEDEQAEVATQVCKDTKHIYRKVSGLLDDRKWAIRYLEEAKRHCNKECETQIALAISALHGIID